MQLTAMNLSKKYGRSLVVDHLTFSIGEGRITGFLGPNGAGKSTTLRMLAGLHRPDTGSVLYDGRALRTYAAPLQTVGTLLDAGAFDPRSTPRRHLSAQAATHGISRKQVDDVIAVTGLSSVANRRIGSFSLGMSQRVGIANALLGDPQVLILDEPLNGLDADGVRWLRTTLRERAQQGCSILISSHLMAEMAQTADHVIVIGNGRILADAPVADVIESTNGRPAVRVRTMQLDALVAVLPSTADVERTGADTALIRGIDAGGLGSLSAANAIALLELAAEDSSLEDAYLKITADTTEYRTGATA